MDKRIDPFGTVDEAAAFYAEAFRKFIFLRGVISCPSKVVDPSEFKLPGQPTSLSQVFGIQLAEDFPRLFANRINAFSKDILSLTAWQQIRPEYESVRWHYLEHEFVYPLLRLALKEPSALKNQAIFSITKLATVLEASANSHAIPADVEINLTKLDLWASHWPRYDGFRTSISALNTRAFVSATRDFRNRDMHTLAPDFYGIVPAPNVRREKRDVLTTWKHEEPLEINPLIDILIEQHRAAINVLGEMRELLMARLEQPIA